MFCEKCGKQIPDASNFCCGCGAKAEYTQADPFAVGAQAWSQPKNELIGREYTFSGNDLVIRGRWGVKYNISVGEDRLNIETVPARKNKIPAVKLEDIMAVQESFHMRTANILLAIFGLILGFCGGIWGFILPIFVLLCFRERKMKIHLRNGKVLTIYSDDKESTVGFIEDMRKITKIK